MKYSKWIGLLGVALLIFAAYQPWVWVASKNITVTGMHTEGTNFGRPALLNLFVSSIAAVLFMMKSVMAARANLFVCGFNIAWTIRNYFIVSTCRAGECPEQKLGLYILMVASLMMLVAALFPGVKLKEEE